MMGKQSSHQGVVVLMIIVFLALGLVGGLFFTSSCQHYADFENHLYHKLVARTIAESGIARALAQLRTTGAIGGQLGGKIGTGQYQVTAQNITATRWQIHSRSVPTLRSPGVYVVAIVDTSRGKLTIQSWLEGSFHEKK